MKRSVIFVSLILISQMGIKVVVGQKSCHLNVVGTWKEESPGRANSVLYRFGPDGRLTVLSGSGLTLTSEPQEIAGGTYALDDPRAPKVILLEMSKDAGGFTNGMNSMEIVGYDDNSLTLAKPGSGQIHWSRVDPHRYFIVLAGRRRVFFDQSGPAFPMLIRTDGTRTQIDAVGIYSVGNKWAFGSVPEESYSQFMRESSKDSDVILRLEIVATQYERALKILRTWDRRSRQGDLLYPDLFLDNVMLVKQVTETLNECGDKIKLYKLDWMLNDRISQDNPPSHTPFLYFRELRRLNESLHVRDSEFYKLGGFTQPARQSTGLTHSGRPAAGE